MKTKNVTFIIFSLIFLYFFAVYNVNFHGPDEPVYYAYTASIVEDGDLNIINQIDMGFFNFSVSKTYNWPDNHSYGSIILWAPFYGYAKFIYFLATKLNLKSLTIWDFSRIAKCIMSFSTIVFGLFIIFFTYKLCRVFSPTKSSLCSVAMVSLGTPFFYYLIHDVGQANIVGCFLSVLLIWFSSYMINMKKLDWFFYGAFFSICVATRVELWMQILFVSLFFIILCKSKRIIWKNSIYFTIGFIPIFILRAVNAYIKFGTFHMEELLPLNTALHFYCPFNGLFSSYRSVFYTSPILYICLLGLIFVIVNILKNHNIERRMQNLFLFILSTYLVIKLFFVSRAFGFGIDILGSRWLLSEFPIFVLLFAQVLHKDRLPFRIFVFIFSSLSILWNFLIISESMTALDWVYLAYKPGISARFGTTKYIVDSLFYINNPGIKLKYCLPLVLVVLGIVFYLASKFTLTSHPSFWYMKDGNNCKSLKLFTLFSIYLCIIYVAITLLNVYNNKRNVERLKAKGFFKNANIIITSAIKPSEFEENYHHLHPLVELMRYYALKGNLKMMEGIIDFKEKYKEVDSRFYPEFAKPHRGLINAYKEAGRYKKTIDCYQEIIRIRPGNIEGYIGLGDIYMLIDEYNKAIEIFKEGDQISPNNDLIYYRMGKSYHKIGEYDKAIGYFEKTIQLRPNFADAYINLGHIYHTKGNYEKAIGYYQETIKLNPDFIADAYINLGYIYNKRCDTQNVLKQIIELRKLNRDDLADELEHSIRR